MPVHSRTRSQSIVCWGADNADAFMENLGTHFDVVLTAIAAGRAELIRIHREGLIEDEVLHNLERDLDVEELGVVLQRSE